MPFSLIKQKKIRKIDRRIELLCPFAYFFKSFFLYCTCNIYELGSFTFYDFTQLAIYLLMDKLGQVTIDNSLNLTVTCQVDQTLLAKNFTTILNALKELQTSQQKTDAQLKELSSLKDTVNQLGLKVDKIDKNIHSNNSNNANNSNTGLNSGNLDDLSSRVEKSEKNIMDNIKDINLINKEIEDLKKITGDLRNNLDSRPNSEGEKSEKTSYGLSDVAANLSKELSLNSEKIKELQVKLMKADEQIVKHDKDIKSLLENKDKNNVGPALASSSSGKTEKDLEDLKKDLRDKLEIINRKISNLQSDYDNHDQQINDIKDMINNEDTNKKENEGPAQSQQNKEEVSLSRQDFLDLKRKIQEVDKRQVRDIKNLMEEINKLKQELRSQSDKFDEKLNSEDDSRLNNKKSTIQKDDINERLNDLIQKVNYLQKLIASSKSSFNDDKNPEKLPNINRTRARNGNLTVYQEKDKSGISRKDISELKAQLQAWIRSLFEQNKGKQNIEDLELKIQEIRRALQRKADGESTKKGFSFLENKITQLYLFLTEPESQDAMIVRKGFQCLSCSKKVEKLRGKIGPKVNWNNMTTTNYSPPRVGYSKPMGENSVEREDDV